MVDLRTRWNIKYLTLILYVFASLLLPLLCAESLAIWRAPTNTNNIEGDDIQWPITVPSTWPRADSQYYESDVGVLKNCAAARTLSGYYQVCVVECGLPFRCMQFFQSTEFTIDTNTVVSNGYSLPWKYPKPWGGYLPTKPLILPFAGNTLCCLALLLALHAMASGSLRWYRRYRGRCQVCGYDISHLASRCPECGNRLQAEGVGVNAKRFFP